MTHLIIENYNEFVKFCNKNYETSKKSNFREEFEIELSSEFSDFKNLLDYLDRFKKFRNDTVLHKMFLDKISFKIFGKSLKFFNWGVVIEIDFFKQPFNYIELSNLLLLCAKSLHVNKNINFRIDIRGIRKDDYWDISTYVSSLVLKYKSNLVVRCEERGEFKKVASKVQYGFLPPAVFVTTENLHLLQQPLSSEMWKQIIGYGDGKKFGEGEEFNPFNKEFKPYFEICYKYLFGKSNENISGVYQEIREMAYKSAEFANFVETIPFLALLIFAMYDNSYRKDLLSDAKGEEYYNTKKLNKSDFLLEEQGVQNYSRYEIYKVKRNDIDVKNLLNQAVDGDNNKSKLHSTVISEIFECVSIAEGLLQILENAALHAGGGLFSMRIYSRAKQLTTENYKKEAHVKYLNKEYSPEYFELDEIKRTSYFLEVQISDMSDKSIPKKFVKNYTDKADEACDEDNEIKELITKWSDAKKINLQYFFEPNGEQIEIKKEFFQKNNKNIVFHYGLEIFKTLVTARKGVFAVCGYGDTYQNFWNIYFEIEEKKRKLIGELKESFSGISEESHSKLENRIVEKKNLVVNNITQNKSISGTTYRILLPLNHKSKTGSVAFADEVEISVDDTKCVDENEICYIATIKDLNKLIFSDLKDIDINSKRKRILAFSSEINNKYSKDKINLLCLNFDKDYVYFEEKVKGCVLFALNKVDKKLNEQKSVDNVILPIAFVNLTPFQLIEAARILAIFYSNNDVARKSSFEHLQFYLKSIGGEDLVFAGNNIQEVRERLLKTAMANGTMNNDLTVIDQLLGRMT